MRPVADGGSSVAKLEDAILSTHRTVTRVAGLGWSRRSCSRPVHRGSVGAARLPHPSQRPRASTRIAAAASARRAAIGGSLRGVHGRSAGASAGASAANMDGLVAAAKAEGNLTTIALPHDWCNYGEAIDGFTAKYGITVNELNPDGGSATRSRRSRPTRTTRARRRRTSSTSACLRPAGQDRRADPALQGHDLGHDPGHGQGRRRLLVRRLLRRPVVRGEHRRRQRTSRRTGPTCSSPTTRARSPSPATRPSSNQAIRRLGRRPRQRRLARQRRSRASTSSRSSTTSRQLRADHRQDGDRRQGETPIRLALDLQRPRRQGLARRATRRSTSSSRRPAGSAACTSRRSAPTRRTRTPPSCGWSTSTPTRARTSG